MTDQPPVLVGFKEILTQVKQNWGRNRIGYLRFALIDTVFVLGTLFILGPGFFLIVYSFFLFIRYFFPYWEPAYRAMQWLMGTKGEIIDNFPVPINGVSALPIILKSLVILAMWVGGFISFLRYLFVKQASFA